MKPEEKVKAKDLDIEGEVFGMMFGNDRLCHLFTKEDDDTWEYLTSFGRDFLRDLSQVVSNFAIKLETMPEAIGNG